MARRPNAPTRVSRRGPRRATAGYVLVVLIAVLASFQLHRHITYGIAQARADFYAASHQQATGVAAKVGTVLRDIYQGLRTIARLPGVQVIDRYGANFGHDARRAVQEIYNNLSKNVDMSEVYIVPAAFNPDAIDPHTGKPEETIVTFDEYIVGKSAQRRDKGRGIEEVEIYEYRLMRQQIAWLKTHHPDTESFSDLDYPAVGGPEVVTCDNRRYSLNDQNDTERSGLVYSVPFYGPLGIFRGLITGVVLSPVLSELLPNGNFALRHTAHDFTILGPGHGQALASLRAVNGAQTDPALGYSEVLAIGAVDGHGAWTLWSGLPNDAVDSLQVIRTQEQFGIFGYATIVTVATMLIFYIRIKTHEATELEERVDQRTVELARANERLTQARVREMEFTDNAAHELRTPLAAILALTDAAETTVQDTNDRFAVLANLKTSARRAARLVDQLVLLARLDPDGDDDDESITLTSLDLAALTAETIALLYPEANARAITLSLVASDNALRIRGNAASLGALVRNLLENGIHYTEPGGAVEVRVEKADSQITLKVCDNGVGIPHSQRQRVFDRFYRIPGNTQPGSGLGLSIVARIARAHHADIHIGQNGERGTVVSVTFKASM